MSLPIEIHLHNLENENKYLTYFKELVDDLKVVELDDKTRKKRLVKEFKNAGIELPRYVKTLCSVYNYDINTISDICKDMGVCNYMQCWTSPTGTSACHIYSEVYEISFDVQYNSVISRQCPFELTETSEPTTNPTLSPTTSEPTTNPTLSPTTSEPLCAKSSVLHFLKECIL